MDSKTLVDTLLTPPENKKPLILKVRDAHNLEQNFVALQKDSAFFSAFYSVLEQNNIDVFNNFLSEQNIPLNAVLQPYGESLLLMVLNVYASNISAYLIEQDCLLDYISSSSYQYKTALQQAISTGQPEFIQPLLDKKVNVNLTNGYNQHLISQIFMNFNMDEAVPFISSILDAGFDPRLLNILGTHNSFPFLINCMDRYSEAFGAEYNEPVLRIPALIFNACSHETLEILRADLKNRLSSNIYSYDKPINALLKLSDPILEKKSLEQNIDMATNTSHKIHKI